MTTSSTQKSGKQVFMWILSLSLFGLLAFAFYEAAFKKEEELNSGILKLEATFKEHKKELWTARFSPDGLLIASGSVDSTVQIWRKKDGLVLQTLKQPAGITSLDFSPDGKYLVTGSYDQTVRVWDWAVKKTLLQLKGHAGTIWSVVFSPDGKSIASSGEDKLIRLWDAADGKLLKTFTGHTRNIWKVRFSPNGKNLVSSGFDTDIKIWNTPDGALVRTLKGHSEAVVGLAISFDGKLIASGSDDKTIKLWDFKTGNPIRTMKVGEEHVYAVAFSPDGKYLINGNRDKGNIGEVFQNFLGDSDGNKGITMRLWEVQTGKLLQTMAQHSNDVMDVSISKDGQWIVSASTDKTVQLWKIVK
jgi:uncharacterized protein with WD repeat